MSNNILLKLDNGERVVDRELGVGVHDYVYINEFGKADKANASSIDTMPCIGKVVRVIGDKCVIKKDFFETEYEGVEPKKMFFISSDSEGEITDEAPISIGSVVQSIGIAISEEKILVNINPSNIIIRS